MFSGFNASDSTQHARNPLVDGRFRRRAREATLVDEVKNKKLTSREDLSILAKLGRVGPFSSFFFAAWPFRSLFTCFHLSGDSRI